MTNYELKGLIEEMVMDEEELDLIAVLEGDEFADGAVGLTDDNRVVYSYERLVKSIAQSLSEEGQNPYDKELEAIEWIDYNTIRSLPYIESQGLKAPIIIYEFPY